ncbi:MAG: M13 family metallopeptidase [Bacteroidota bacterium]
MIGKLTATASAFILLSAFNSSAPTDTMHLGVDIKSMDVKVIPANDFYMYANGNWVKNNPVPADEAHWGSFDELQQENQNKIKLIFEEVAKDKQAANGTARQKLRDFYNTALDTLAIEQQGFKPAQPLFDMVNQMKSKSDLTHTIAELYKNGIGNTFVFYVHRDLKKSDQNVCYLRQGGFQLPDRDYYLKDDDQSKKIKEEYIKHIAAMFSLKGDKEGEIKAKSILKIETAMAEVSKSRVELRDQEKNYNKWTIQQLQSAAPAINWTEFFTEIEAGKVDNLIMGQPAFFERLNKMITDNTLEEWKAYLQWKVITSSASFLSSKFVKEDFHFYNTVLNGQTEMKPRWKDVVDVSDNSLGEIVGQVYVEKYFSPKSKERVKSMVSNILSVYRQRIENLDWMSAETKKKAQEKLSRFNTKLGYPDKWKDYSTLKITTESYFENFLACSRFGFKYMVSKLGKPVDKSEWNLLPHTVNAYYDPTLNEIVFPAAIMQPPFFYPEADDAVNYGAIGAVIGHEITHGFDDQGSKYDGTGNLNNWWTEEDRTKFNAKTKLLVEQFTKYEALPNVFVNGELTLGENIADLGGLNVAYNAYQLSMKGKTKEVLAGFSAEQRFFLAFGQVWKGNYKDEYLRKMVLTNVHSPGNFRAVGAPSNMTEFYEAFNVKQGDKMYRDDAIRAKIW